MKVMRQISPECVIGSCPAVFEVIAECGIGTCPTVLKASNGDLVIIGWLLTDEERQAVGHHIKAGEETAVRVPKSLIASLKF